MKKLNKRVRTTGEMCSVQQYTTCAQAAESYCISECRRLGTDNYGMTFPKAEIASNIYSG